MARILLVDDYPITQQRLSRQLERAGHSVIAARNRWEMWTLLNAMSVDAVVVDICPRESEAFELVTQLRMDARFQELPVVVVGEEKAGRLQRLHDARLWVARSFRQLVAVVYEAMNPSTPLAA